MTFPKTFKFLKRAKDLCRDYIHGHNKGQNSTTKPTSRTSNTPDLFLTYAFNLKAMFTEISRAIMSSVNRDLIILLQTKYVLFGTGDVGADVNPAVRPPESIALVCP